MSMAGRAAIVTGIAWRSNGASGLAIRPDNHAAGQRNGATGSKPIVA